MHNDTKLESQSRGIRPVVWLPILGLIIAGAVTITLSRRSAIVPDSTTPAGDAPAPEEDAAPAGDPRAFRSPPATAPADAQGVPRNAPEQIKATFQKYVNALLDGDGEIAWSLLDSHTTRFYSQMLRDALSLPRAELTRLDYMHKITVLRLRAEIRKPELQRLTGRDVFVLAVTNGWISKSTIQSASALTKVAVNGRYATGYIPQEPRAPFHFIYEDSQWKIALWRVFEAANAMMKQMKQESGLSENDFILALIRQVSKYEVSEVIFEGPIE